MNNTTRRRYVALVIALLGIACAVVASSHSQSSTEVVTGDETTSTGVAATTAAPTTTEVPETTTAVSTTTTVVPATTVVDTTTTPPVAQQADTSTTVPASVATTSAPLKPQEDTGIQPVGAGDPQAAVRTETGKCVAPDPATCNPPTTPPRQAWRYCEEWHDLAAAVGWPESAGPTLSYVMHRESGCDPNARNRSSGAAGLLQLLGHNCGGSCFDPENNLRTGLALYHGRGWCDWVLHGDPVTGHACG